MRKIAKTEQTIKLEKQIYNSTKKQGVFGCYEVTIGWFGKERVDYMTYDTKGIYRCFEIKVSKSDFFSKAKVSFLGHYNYYVLTPELYKDESIRQAIPENIGVYIGDENYYSCDLVKRAKKQELQVNEQVLKDSMIRSLTRYFDEKIKNEDEYYLTMVKREMKSLEGSINSYRQENNDLKHMLYHKFGSRWRRVLEDMEDKYE